MTTSLCPERTPSFGAYAKTCVYHKLSQAVTRNLRRQNSPEEEPVSLEDSPETLSDPTAPSPDEIVIYRDEMERLVEKIRKALSPFENRVLSSYLEGYSFDEMAEILKGAAPEGREIAVFVPFTALEAASAAMKSM